MARFAKLKSFLFFLLVGAVLSGCSTVSLPKYVPDEHPYKQLYYASFDETLDAVTQVLDKFHWTVTEKTYPSLFERNRDVAADGSRQQALIFTEVRTTMFGLGTRYSRVNVYLRSVAANETEVEVRYVTVTSIPFKTFYDYKKNKTVNAMLKKLADILGT